MNVSIRQWVVERLADLSLNLAVTMALPGGILLGLLVCVWQILRRGDPT